MSVSQGSIDQAARLIRARNPRATQVAANAAAWAEGKRLLERAIAERLTFAFETTLGGKTMTALSLLRLQPRPVARIVNGAIRLLGENLIEKTVARTAPEFEPVVAAAAASGAHLQIHFPWRFHPAVRQMRALLDEGLLGRPTSLAAHMVTSQAGTLRGGFAPSTSASNGSQVETGAGSSSTTL